MCEGYELSIVIEKINGTLIIRPILTKCPEDPTPIIAATFLSVIFVAAFLLNMMVVVTVATSYSLKRFLFCRLLVSLCATCMVDCFLNITLAIGYVTTAPWRFGVYLSYFNGFTINMLNSEMAFAVLLLTVDRVAAVRKCKPYLSMAKYKIGIIVSVTWLIAFLMALPLLLGVIQSMPYRNRYSCAVADPQDDYYLIIHVVLVLCVTTVVMLCLVILTSFTFHRERKKQKKVRSNQSISYFDQIMMTPYYRNEFYPAAFVAFTVIIYLIFWMPFLTLSTVGPIVTKHWKNETSDESENDDSFSLFNPKQRSGVRMTKAMLDESQLQALNHTNITSEVTMSNITVNPWQIPEIIGTPAYDTVFIWLRFLFDLLVPILVFIILKDVKAKCEGLIMWCRPNSVTVASPKPTRPTYINRIPSKEAFDLKGQTVMPLKKQKSSKDSINFKTPILFATSQGLHIRTVEDTYLDMIENKPLIGFARQNTETPKFTYDLCDVMLGYDDLTDFDVQFTANNEHDSEKETGGSELAAANPVVIAANRAAMGQKPVQDLAEYDDNESIVQLDIPPPTPPKVQIKGNDPAIEFGETIEIDVDKQFKGKKNVRFATVLSEDIPRPGTGESSVLNNSVNSSRSSDSGIMADNERSSPSDEKSQIKMTGNKKRHRVSQRAIGKRIPRPPPKRLQGNSKKFASSSTSQNASFFSNKNTITNIRNIKSRHMPNVRSSTATTEEKVTSPPPRRFSKAKS